jgi:hypothetical protein
MYEARCRRCFEPNLAELQKLRDSTAAALGRGAQK